MVLALYVSGSSANVPAGAHRTQRAIMWSAFRAIVMATSLSVVATAAQGETIVKTFEAGGVTHVVSYPDWREQAVQAVEEAVAHAFSVFQPLWTGSSASSEIGFQVYAMLSEDKPADRRADALLTDTTALPAGSTATRPSVCHITIYNYLLDRNTLFEIAHELAHCYQTFFVPSKSAHAEPGTKWWVEGSADWLALLAYPNADWSNLDYHGYATTHRRYLFALSYDAVFFFEFLASPMGHGSPEAVIEFLRGMPAPASTVTYEDYLASVVGDAGKTFHDYMVAIGRNYLPRAPQVMTATVNIYDVSPLPFEGPIPTEPFSIDYYKLIGLGTDDFFIEGVNLDNAGMRASIITNGGDAEL